MLQGFLIYLKLPDTIIFAVELEFDIFLPSVKIADKVQLGGIWRPLAKHPTALYLMHSEIEISGGKIRQTFIIFAQQLLLFLNCIIMSTHDCQFKRLQVDVIL